MTIKLITAEEFSNYRNISKKQDTSKIDESIKEAQSVDLFDVLGSFLFDVITNKDNVVYADLMTGSTFTCDGESYIQEGIKSVLADYTYSRYLYKINTNHTPFGLQQKFTNNSQPVERNILKDMQKQTLVDANIKFRMIDKYLRENQTTFSRYCTGNDSTITSFSQKFSIL